MFYLYHVYHYNLTIITNTVIEIYKYFKDNSVTVYRLCQVWSIFKHNRTPDDFCL